MRVRAAVAGLGLMCVLAAPAGAVYFPTTSNPYLVTLALDEARGQLERNDYARAMEALRLPVEANNADGLAMMGYALRKSGDRTGALAFYRRALTVAPDHIGATEYLGELFVEAGESAKAREQLDRLEAICGTECEAYLQLAAALAGAAAALPPKRGW